MDEKRLQIRISEKLLQDLDGIAEHMQMTRSGVIRYLIRREAEYVAFDPAERRGTGGGTTTPPPVFNDQ